ncbi:MAG: FAD-dependent oxidoreductase [Gammaproteobacteria bacterium]|nr:FAD-dependent oxidoreductase [Gammaproteobacteria bacterium]MDH3534875.1 FAD-dependent oxidoreductase [Gammaproteobacteria bacterium]
MREENIDAVASEIFDVAIIGGGINGACLYNQLCSEGRHVILLEKADFGSGTSQASAMMVWGGLLYLGSLDFRAVYSFSSSRDKMIHDMAEWVSPCWFRFLPAQRGLLSKAPVALALYLYWLIGQFKRGRPRIEKQFPEKDLLARDNISLMFEEARIRQSDARFVLHWITRNTDSGGVALNYCELEDGEFSVGENTWHLSARDRIGNQEINFRTRSVINCAGVWTDRLNASFGIPSPYKHVFSKGVILGMRRHLDQVAPMIFDMGEHNDVITSIPWGPIGLWGPTETAVPDIEQGFSASPEDIHFLLNQYNRCYRRAATRKDVVSLRCGIRPLVVEASYDKDEYPLELSRRSRITVNKGKSWVSVYGSKITGCRSLAASVARRLDAILPERQKIHTGEIPADRASAETFVFPGLVEKFPTIDWCMEHEYCNTLEDYLRRRTNISQWVPREGLGYEDENLPLLREMSLTLAHGNRAKAEQHLAAYRADVANRFDRVLENV